MNWNAHFGKIGWVALALAAAGCSSAQKGKIVRTESGRMMVVGAAKNESDAILSAIDHAEKHCSNENKVPVFEDESIDEGSGRNAKLNLKSIPFLGKILKDDDRPSVTMEFSCG